MAPEGSIVYDEEPIVARKIADTVSMKNIREMLRNVITKGTGQNAKIAGWQVAGKTGTAQKWKDGDYSNDKFISNFIGFLPYEDPQLLALVMLDEPSKPFHWGNEGAAVAFKRIMERIINMDDSILPPSKKKPNDIIEMDKVITHVNNENKKFENKLPPMQLSTLTRNTTKTIVPEVRGLSMRRAMATLNNSNLKYKISGSGKVYWQHPKPGLIVDKGMTCVVDLK
jgi:cell division protein FtsI (penicillin-binding protein 3)